MYEMSRTGKYIQLESRLVVAEGWNKDKGIEGDS
jgi:hypothetical protein